MIDGTFDINDYDSNDDGYEYGDEENDYDSNDEDETYINQENERNLIRQSGFKQP